MENKFILVVDHDPEHLSLTESRLQARNFSVLTARTSRDAVTAIGAQNFDLVMISARMELVDGQDLAVKVRKATSHCYVPIILMLGNEDLAELLHGLEQGFDDFLIVPFDTLTLQLRVLLNIRRMEERMQANPLTKLPGNVAIERAVKERIASGGQFSVVYLDINHFKSFNDVYGYDKGDDVIRQTSRIINQAARKWDPDHCFVGHVGGDDFIALLHPDHEKHFARECMREFDRIIPTCYSQEDIRRGFLAVTNRKGKSERFPLMSISVAAVTNLYRKYSNPAEIAQVAAEVKKFLKTQSGSNYLRDRRERQITALEEAMELLPETSDPAGSEEPLGQFLLAAGLVTEEQLGEALKQHLSSGKRLGQVLISMNLVNSLDVGRMLEKKLGVPYVSLAGRELPRELIRLIRPDYVRTHRVMPVEIRQGKLVLAMLDPFDIKVIDDIERITNYRVSPNIALEGEFETLYDKYYSRAETA
jgi:diguanylate cyclase (GGDEF)-like protein